jgi:hypothetical protein
MAVDAVREKLAAPTRSATVRVVDMKISGGIRGLGGLPNRGIERPHKERLSIL